MTIGHTFFSLPSSWHDQGFFLFVSAFIQCKPFLDTKKKKKIISDHRWKKLTQIRVKGDSEIIWHDTEVRLLSSWDEGVPWVSLLKFIGQNHLLRPHVVVVPNDHPLEIGAEYVDGFRLNWRLRRSCEWRRRRRYGLCFPLLSLAAAAPDPICNTRDKVRDVHFFNTTNK